MDRRDRTGARAQVPPRGPGRRPAGPGYRDPAREPRPLASQPLITPLRVTLTLGLAIGVVLLVVALVVQRAQDVPFLAAACAVLGLSLAAIAVTGAVATYRAAAHGRGGRAFGLAFLGGIAGIGAFGFLALAVIFGVLWKAPT